MDETELLTRVFGDFAARLDRVPATGWHGPTPCTTWDVRALVNHATYEAEWLAPLLRGETMGEIGSRYDGDLLGDDPVKVWEEATAQARAAAAEPGNLERTVVLTQGPTSGAAYVGQVAADLAVHTWDLARAIGADERLDPALVAHADEHITPELVEVGRRFGVFAAEPALAKDADRQTRVLARMGRWADPTFAALARFWRAADTGDRAQIAAAVAEDFFFDAPPPPDGQRYEGREAGSTFFAELAASAQRTFRVEEAVTAGDRAIVRWRHEWTNPDSTTGHVRGIDLFRVRDGLIAEKLSYVKG